MAHWNQRGSGTSVLQWLLKILRELGLEHLIRQYAVIEPAEIVAAQEYIFQRTGKTVCQHVLRRHAEAMSADLYRAVNGCTDAWKAAFPMNIAINFYGEVVKAFIIIIIIFFIFFYHTRFF